MQNEQPPVENQAIGGAQAVRRGRHRRLVGYALGVLLVYFVAAYVLMPLAWGVRVDRHPALDHVPGITSTATGIPGDPINVALVGSKSDIVKIMLAAKWYPADPLSLRSSLKIGAATHLERARNDAGVSGLYLWERIEDLAFEQPVGPDPNERHHVRFWESEQTDAQGRPLWAGSATFDICVGPLPHKTGQITHHIAENIDAERDHLFKDLEATGDLSEIEKVPGFHKILEGRNGGGVLWKTDGQLFEGVIAIKSGAPVSDGSK
ncbi:MAG TPA: LssY C-terminal domain-containing protein [Gemmataceae bacterium]|jgi:hypothetical protein|nr:LssY C-terminal domain-containing protein [Gemmataceae bacterium]